MTTEPAVPDDGYVHIGNGEYKFNATLFKRGNYRLEILLKDPDGRFRGISGSPFYLEVQPNNASQRYSFVNGTGADVTDAVYVGRVENINLYVKDIYDNFYNQTGTEYVPVNDTTSQSIYGSYQLDYQILRFCTNITINVTIATYNLNTSMVEMMHIQGSPFVVPVKF
jgi:hypothetical protein